MAKHMVKCLVCGEMFDANEENYKTEGRRYIHESCIAKRNEDNFFIDDIHTYIKIMYGPMYSKSNINKQIKEMLNDGKTLEGINKTLKYWYTVKKNDPQKSKGSIRIVNYVYDEAMEYYKQLYNNLNANKDININTILNQEIQEVNIKPKPIGKPKKVKLFDLR